MELEEGQVVLCTVDKIIGTAVFVKIEDNGEGTIVTSEIAPGRIRNLRDYVVPNKKIVCKILSIDYSGGIHLSLRRVSAKERKEVLEQYSKEKSLIATLKTIVKDAEKVIEKIKKSHTLVDFFEKVKEVPDLLEKLVSKEEAQKLLKIINEKKEKEVSVKREFQLKSEACDGIVKIKKILPEEVSYLGSGRYFLTIRDKNYKDANIKLNSLLEEIGKKAKQEGLFFDVGK